MYVTELSIRGFNYQKYIIFYNNRLKKYSEKFFPLYFQIFQTKSVVFFKCFHNFNTELSTKANNIGEAALPRRWRSLLTHSMWCLLASWGSYSKTCQVSAATRSTLTHQSGLPRGGFLPRDGLEATGLYIGDAALPWIWRSLLIHSMWCLLASWGSYS